MSQLHKKKEEHQHSLLYYNLKYAKVGLLVGVGICALNFFHDFRLSWKSVFACFLFSMTITLSITNLIYLSHCLFKRQDVRNVRFVVLNFVLMGIGIFFATEFCFFVLYLLEGKWTPLKEQYNNLVFNLFLGFFIGGYNRMITLQKENYEYQLKENEYQLSKLEELKTRAELETLQAKINPHFLYNSLNSIASLVHTDPEKAEKMVLMLSKLFRLSINSSEENFGTIANEIDIVKTYLDIETIRLGDRLSVTIFVEEGLQDVKIPRFLLQPLVENSIKHGISKLAEKGEVLIEVKALPDNQLAIWVGDNGPDFPTEINPGYGMQSTFDKLKLLYGDNHTLNILSTARKGIQIIIPKLVDKELTHEIY